MSWKVVKEAVRCGHEGCCAIKESEVCEYFCDTCGTNCTDSHLELTQFKKKYEDDDNTQDYDFCSWRCLFKKAMTLRNVDFLSLPLATSRDGRTSKLAELRRFVKPLLDAENVRINVADNQSGEE